MAGTKTRVAILGGGMAGLATAFELTATPELCDRYEVTVHTLGWRLGGKGASSRNAERRERIEEHGLHVWFGFYENAFDLIRRTYAELQPAWTVDEHFTPVEEIVLGERWKGEWVPHRFHPPVRPGEPGVGATSVEFWDVAETMLAWVRDLWKGTTTLAWLRAAAAAATHGASGGLRLLAPRRPSRVLLDLSAAALTASRGLSALAAAAEPWSVIRGSITDAMLRDHVDRMRTGGRDMRHVPMLAHELSVRRAEGRRPLGERPHTPIVTDLLREFRDWLWPAVVEPALDDKTRRYLYCAVDVVTAALTGIVEEDLAARGFAAIDDMDLRAWLRKHGASATSVEQAPWIRGLYDLAFAYRDGDTTRPDLAAGKAIQALVRMGAGYNGALMYKLNEGMGETIFAPLYEVLSRRGVRFRFFDEVTEVRVDRDRRVVSEIEIRPQAELAGGRYRPLVDGAWPAAPLWRELADGTRLARSGIDFEHDRDPEGPQPYVLRLGAEENGFEHVVLAISIGSMPGVVDDVAGTVPRFERMLASSSTVGTQAIQLWLSKPLAEVGWRFAPDGIASAFREPLATLAAMGHLRACEPYSKHLGVRDIVYSCGPLAAGGDAVTRAMATHDDVLDMLGAGLAAVLDAVDGFDWGALVDPAGGVGSARLEAQYTRANTRGSERYVTSYAGTVADRLAPDESGLANLALAGDWTRNGIDGGCMEAAVASGRLAARAISGEPATVPGTTGWLASDGWATSARAFVQYGGVTTIPSPYRSEDATLHGFWARANGTRLDELCRRVFTEPSGGEVEVRAIGDHVMLTWGQIPRVSSLDPAFAGQGFVDEDQVAVWVPVVEVRRGAGGAPVAERFAMFVPYIWLNNPMSLTTGREVVGYAKSWGVPTFPPDGAAAPCSLTAFGLRKAGEQAALHPLLEVAAAGGEAPLGEVLGTLHDVAWHAARELLPGGPDALGLGFALAGGLLHDLAGNRLRSLFLKQIRDVEGAGGAALTQITETSYVVRRFRARPMSGTFRLTVHPMASQPIEAELGLTSQTIELAYRCGLDFDVRDTRVVWP